MHLYPLVIIAAVVVLIAGGVVLFGLTSRDHPRSACWAREEPPPGPHPGAHRRTRRAG